MTLIAAFRCTEGVILCADSQETVGAYRVRVEKIAPVNIGSYHGVIGGAGHGPLIDGFTERLREEMQTWEDGLSPSALKAKVRTLLLDYHRNEVAVSPGSPEDKDIRFILCVRDATTGKVHLLKLHGPSIKTVDHYSLIGWEEAIYSHEVARLYRPNAPALRCILLGVHLFLLASATSNYIGGPMEIIGVRDTSMWAKLHPRIRQAYEQMMESVWVEAPERVRELEQRMSSLNDTMSQLLLDCADTTIHSKEFAERLNQFQQRMLQLRDAYIRSAMYSDLVAMQNKVGKPAIGILPPYHEYSGEVVSLKEGDPLAQLLNSIGGSGEKSDTGDKADITPSDAQKSEPQK